MMDYPTSNYNSKSTKYESQNQQAYHHSVEQGYWDRACSLKKKLQNAKQKQELEPKQNVNQSTLPYKGKVQ